MKKLGLSVVAAGIGIGGAMVATNNKSIIAGVSIALFVASFAIQKWLSPNVVFKINSTI